MIGAWFVPNTPYSKKSIWTHPIELPGEDPQKKARFRLFRDSANFDVRLVHSLRGVYHMLENQFGSDGTPR